MERTIRLALIGCVALLLTAFSGKAQENEKIQIMLVGFDHLSQLDDGTPQSDVFSQKKQAEIIRLTKHLSGFSPDMIMVEVEPGEQPFIDSMYRLYTSNTLKLKDIEYGSGETYQVGFRLGKMLHLDKIYGVDHYESTSQSLLESGENIELFRKGLKGLQSMVRPMKQKVQQDSLPIYDYIAFMNQPENIKLTHQLFYNMPAYVVNGDFSDSGTNTVDLGEIDEDYIGAEYITLFYNRNLKIYSNILNAQLKTQSKKLLLIMGQVHIGVLQDIIEDNPNYQIISPLKYLNPQELN